MTAFDVLEMISTAYFCKQMYFLEDDGSVYSRYYGKHMSLEEAVEEFADYIYREEA